MHEKPSKLESAITLILWGAVSYALWMLLPDRFTSTDGPAGVFFLAIVGIVGMFIAVMLILLAKRLLGKSGQ